MTTGTAAFFCMQLPNTELVALESGTVISISASIGSLLLVTSCGSLRASACLPWPYASVRLTRRHYSDSKCRQVSVAESLPAAVIVSVKHLNSSGLCLLCR